MTRSLSHRGKRPVHRIAGALVVFVRGEQPAGNRIAVIARVFRRSITQVPEIAQYGPLPRAVASARGAVLEPDGGRSAATTELNDDEAFGPLPTPVEHLRVKTPNKTPPGLANESGVRACIW
jgi:hypothetical protein